MPVVGQNGGNVHPPGWTPDPASSTPNRGVWTQDGNGAWTWTWNAAPDPTLVSQWGYEAVTDIRRDPTGVPNHGFWYPQHGGGWTWQWGRNPPDWLVKSWGYDTLTNPAHTPHGADPGPDITDPPPPDVQSPTLTDAWNGIPPDVTGALPIPDSGSGTQTVSEPPVHRAYTVSPGSIRDAESVLLRQVDSQIGDYNYLRSYVETAKTQNLYSDNRERLISAMDGLLLQIGDAVELAGQFTRMLNNAAQSYAKADIDSYLPQS